jgi:ATP/maltotriose-dependent transcriptional regulator MalT
VDVLLGCGEIGAAAEAGAELATTASSRDIPFLQATAAFASGRIRLAEGDLEAALPELRRAVASWLELDVPYDAARARVDLARVLRGLGDGDGADLELQAAARCFERLGAVTDLARVRALVDPTTASPLTEREVEVLRHVANGETNREIAVAMDISEHTVARHLQNTFAKLGVSTRAAATAHGYEHGLL